MYTQLQNVIFSSAGMGGSEASDPTTQAFNTPAAHVV